MEGIKDAVLLGRLHQIVICLMDTSRLHDVAAACGAFRLTQSTQACTSSIAVDMTHVRLGLLALTNSHQKARGVYIGSIDGATSPQLPIAAQNASFSAYGGVEPTLRAQFGAIPPDAAGRVATDAARTPNSYSRSLAGSRDVVQLDLSRVWCEHVLRNAVSSFCTFSGDDV